MLCPLRYLESEKAGEPKIEPSQTDPGSALYPVGGPPSDELATRDSPLTLCDRAPCAGRIAQKAAQSAGLTTAL